MTYTVFTVSMKTGERTRGADYTSLAKARWEAAHSAGNLFSDQVFIEFFRKSDGQRGYINRDGASPVGQAW